VKIVFELDVNLDKLDKRGRTLFCYIDWNAHDVDGEHTRWAAKGRPGYSG